MALRVGIVGYGEAGRLHAIHASRAGAEVAGVVTRREVGGGFVRYVSLESMLPHVDAVTVALPNHLHAAVALEAIRAGKAVLVEKPLAIREPDLDELEEALALEAVPFLVGFRLRWNPSLRSLREQLLSPRQVRCLYRLGIERLAAGKPWTRRAAESGGAFCTLGVHALDLVRWLARARGEPLSDLQASAGHFDDSADFPLQVELSGRLAGGTQVIARADLHADAPFRLELELDSRSVEDRYNLSMNVDEEYGGMLEAFVRRAREGRIDSTEQAELFRVHRDLLAAKGRAAGRSGE